MKYIFTENLEKRLKAAKRIFLFLDFDGTLSKIVKVPEEATVTRAMKKAVMSLAKKKNIVLGIISGRKIKDIRRRAGISNILYAGNHGLEVYNKGKCLFIVKGIDSYLATLKVIGKKLRLNLREKGVLFEDKGAILAVHYRLVAGPYVGRVKSIFKRVVAPYIKAKKIKIGEGKKVLEIRPNVPFSKAGALGFFQGLLKKKAAEPTIYIGDDVTDEDIFKVLKRGDWGIRVGKKSGSRAQYYVRDVKEVEKLLKHLKKIIEDR